MALKTAGDEILTIEEVAAYLKLPKQTVYYLVQRGKIPGSKIGKHWRFSKSKIKKNLFSKTIVQS